MANTLYNAGNAELHKTGGAWDGTNTYRCLLARDTGTYTPNKDHATVQELITNGMVEISVPSYTRKDVTLRTVTVDNATDAVVLDCADVAFGNLESGQTVKAIVFFKFVTNDSDSVPLLWIDTDAGGLLPRPLGGGAFTVKISDQGLIRSSQGA